MGGRQHGMGGMVGQIPRRQQDRNISALGRARRREEQQHLVLAFEERLNLIDDELMMLGWLKTLVFAPFSERSSYRPAAQKLGRCLLRRYG